MFKAALDLIGGGLRVTDMAALVVAVPVAGAVSLLGERPWVAPVIYLVSALLLLVAARLRVRGVAGGDRRATALDAGARADRGPRSTGSALAGPVQAGARRLFDPGPSPAPESRPTRAGSPGVPGPRPAGVQQEPRPATDEVTYRAGNPNVLTMTFVRPAGAEGEARDAPADAGAAASRVDDGAQTVLRIEGALDAGTVPLLRPAFEAIVAERCTSLVVDLEAVPLVDRVGVDALVALARACRARGGDLRVAGLRGQPLALFGLLGVGRVIDLSR